MSSTVHAIFEKLQIQFTEVKNGDELRFRCVHPAHTDTHPSTDINVKTGLWICRSCGRKGNLESIISLVTGEKINLEEYLTLEESLTFKIQALYKKSSDNILKYDDISQFDETIQNELKNFKNALTNKDALSYLTGSKRKLTKETIKKFGLMYSISGDYKDRVVIPYYKDGKMIGFNSRYIFDTDKKYRYMYFISHNQFKDFIYNLDNVVDMSYCILVEGPFDLMILVQLGYKNVISTLSTRVSESHVKHILKFDKIIICFDNDIKSKAGQKAALNTAKLILEIAPHKEVFCCQLPDGKDPTEATPDELKEAFSRLFKFKKKENK